MKYGQKSAYRLNLERLSEKKKTSQCRWCKGTGVKVYGRVTCECPHCEGLGVEPARNVEVGV